MNAGINTECVSEGFVRDGGGPPTFAPAEKEMGKTEEPPAKTTLISRIVRLLVPRSVTIGLMGDKAADIQFQPFPSHLMVVIRSYNGGFSGGNGFLIHDHRALSLVAAQAYLAAENDEDEKEEALMRMIDAFRSPSALLAVRRKKEGGKQSTYGVLFDAPDGETEITGTHAYFAVVPLQLNKDHVFNIIFEGLYNFKSTSSNINGNDTFTLVCALCDRQNPFVVEINGARQSYPEDRGDDADLVA